MQHNKPGRPTGPVEFYLQDDENTMKYNPNEMHGNRFFGQWSKVLTITEMLDSEIQEKYYNDYSAYFKAR